MRILPAHRSRSLSPDIWRKVAALLCIVLLGALTTLAVAHIHHGLASDAGDQHCQLCQLSHSPASTPTQAAIAVSVMLTTLVVATRHSPWLGRVAVRDILTRPPPASL